MAVAMKRLTDFLLEEGVERVSHTQKTYLAHLVGLYRLLEARGFSEEVASAGMFHSIYGTELFQGFKLPVERRGDVRSLIGERAERIAYVNCAMDRASFDRNVVCGTPPYRIKDRLTGDEVELSPEDFDDLCRVHLYDWLEQVERAGRWEYRREGYRNLADRLGEKARQDYEQVFGKEAVDQASV